MGADTIAGADTAMASSSPALAAQAAPTEAVPSAAEISDADKPASDDADDPGDADEQDKPRDSMVGETLAERYEITRKIGQGGMGAVYEATHTLIGKRVAVKVLLEKYAEKDQVVARLKQEARLASASGHPNIIDITDIGTTADGRTFVVMEFLEGESLGQCINRDGPLPEHRAIDIAFQVADALHAAHEKGIVHRDIKPENIFLLKRKGQDFVKVVDFGISKSLRTDDEDGGSSSPRLTQTGMVLGTPLYMSPEQARGADDLDRRIDVYSLGVIMYEMVTGEVPFHGNNYLSIISQVLNDEPAMPRELRPDLSAEFEDTILRALEKEPDDRYQSCEELRADLEVLREDPTRTTARNRLTASKLRRKRNRRSGLRVLAWIAGIAVIIGAVAVVVAVLMRGDKEQTVVVQQPVVPPPVDAAPAKPAVDAGPAVPMVKVTITSKPPGATIYDGGRRLGQTPVEYPVPRNMEVIELIAELEGHNDTLLRIYPAKDGGQEVEVELRKPKQGARIKKLKPKPKTKPPDKAKPDAGTGTAGGELIGNPYKKKPK